MTVRTDRDSTATMTPAECWNALRSNSFGRLAVAVSHQPDIFPVNFVVQDDTVLFRTAPGTKLASLTAQHAVALEIDGFDMTGGWSVVAKGSAQAIEWGDDFVRAQQAPLRPWIATIKPIFVRITPHEVTGRRFVFGDEPLYF